MAVGLLMRSRLFEGFFSKTWNKSSNQVLCALQFIIMPMKSKDLAIGSR
jgi:hypothetical protein